LFGNKVLKTVVEPKRDEWNRKGKVYTQSNFIMSTRKGRPG
jgi:hypothetical protein